MSSDPEAVGCAVVLAFAIAAVAAVNVFIDNYTWGGGTKVGVVLKAPTSGLFAKSTEAVVLAESVPGSGVYSSLINPYDFSTRDPKIAEKLRQADESKEVVIIRYNETIGHSWFTRDTDRIITEIVLTGKRPVPENKVRVGVERDPQ